MSDQVSCRKCHDYRCEWYSACSCECHEEIERYLHTIVALTNRVGYLESMVEDITKQEVVTLSTSEHIEEDINVCPGCGGYADNGFDRCLPPRPYFCKKCEEENP